MSKSGVKTDAFQNIGTANALTGNLTSNAANVYGSLEPQLASEAAHPSGLTPAQKANANTAAQQSAGGSTASTIGQGRLYAARTKNAGGAKSAVGSGVRGAGENLSNAAVGTELENAKMGQQNQRAALGGLQGLNSTELGGGINSLGQSNNALNIARQVQPTFWQKFGQQAGMDTLDAAEAATGLY